MSEKPFNVTKLPKWAQEYIQDLRRERETAIETLNEYLEHQRPSPFFVSDLVSTGEERGPSLKKWYIQSRRVEVEHAGVYLHIMLRDDCIELSYNAPEKYASGNVALIPHSFQMIHLVNKRNMREQ